MSTSPDDIDILLSRFHDPESLAALMRMVYGDLHRMAANHHRRFAHGRTLKTLQATALVNEAYIRLVESGVIFKNRAHFFAAASKAMQRALLDAARKKSAGKRGGGLQQVELEENHLMALDDPNALIAFDEALSRLEAVNPQYRRIAELRYFCSFTAEETAEILGMGVSTLRRHWNTAVEWLRSELHVKN